MAYNGKTNWVNNEIVEAVDMNRIEQGISDADVGLGNVQADIGSQTYTEQNYVTNGESVTASLDAIDTAIGVHLAENVSQVIYTTRDISIVGLQRITTPKLVKSITAIYQINNTKKFGILLWGENNGVANIYQREDTLNFSNSDKITIFDTASRYAQAAVRNVDNTGFNLEWSKLGEPTGTCGIYMLVSYHGGV